MLVEVRLFARLRELCGCGRLELRLPVGADASSCLEMLSSQYPPLAEMRNQMLVAVNERYEDWSYVLEEGDVVAFIPPVSGG
ncbi:MAG: molybdopterin converting factor subunit 1 [Acidobacteriota bacterium]